MAKLIPPDAEPVEPGLGTVRGWLLADDPFLAAVDEIVTARARHRSRGALPRPRTEPSAVR